MLTSILKNVVKHRVKSLFAILISLLIILFLFIYLGGLISNQAQLSNLSYALPVEAKVTNENGIKDFGLRISAKKVQSLEKTNMMKNLSKIAISHADEAMHELTEEEAGKQFFPNLIYSTNTLYGITYLQDISPQELDTSFLDGDEPYCIIEKSHMETLGLKIGDSYNASIYRRKYDDFDIGYQMVYVNKCKMEIVGTYSINAEEALDISTPLVIAPIKYIRQLYKETESIYNIAAVSFTLKNALEMNEFKAAATEAGFTSRNPSGDSSLNGNSILMYDEAFIKMYNQLTENINLMQLFAPLIFVIVALIGFFASYLLIQSRIPELAIMRSLGQSKAKVFLTLLLESLLLSLIGGLLGTLVGYFVIKASLESCLIVLAAFLVFYMLGTIIALIWLNRFSVMEILTKTDE